MFWIAKIVCDTVNKKMVYIFHMAFTEAEKV